MIRRFMIMAAILMAVCICQDYVLGSSPIVITIEVTENEGYNNKLVLGGQGQSSYKIVVPVIASEAENKAALELQKYLKEISGTRLDIVTDAYPVSDTEILLGNSTRLNGMETNINYASLGDDGFVIKTIGKKFVITGNTGNAVLYGTYGFLEKYLGCHWFTSTVRSIPKRSTISLDPINDLQVPSSRFREIINWDNKNADFAMQLRLSGPVVSNSLTQLYDTGSPGLEKHPGWGLFCHTFYQLVPPWKYFAAHPEYYSFIDGERRNVYNNQAAQICTTNTNLSGVIIAELNLRMAQLPGDKYWDVSQNDSNGYCQCAICQAVNLTEGSPSGSILTLVNQIAAAFPSKTISTLAYSYSRKPPIHIKPLSNVLIQLAFLTQKRDTHPLEISTYAGGPEIRQDILSWNSICNNILVWDYYSACNHNLMPNPNLRILQPNIKYYVTHGASSVFPCVNGDRGVELCELRNYLLAKLLWNADGNVDNIINEFLAGYYGNAAGPIRRYIDLIHNSSEASGMALPIFSRPSEYRKGYLSPELVAAYSQLFDEAEYAVANDAEVLNRVQLTRLSIMYIQLELNYGSIDEREQIAQKFFNVAERNSVVIIGDRRSLPRYRSTIMARLKKERSLLYTQLGYSTGADIVLSASVSADKLAIELLNSDSQNIGGYIIYGMVGGAWQIFCRGNQVGYRVIQPLVDGSPLELSDSGWQSEDLPHAAVTQEDFWAPFDKNVPLREPLPEKWYRKKIVVPVGWNGQDISLQLGCEGVDIDDDVLCAVYFNGCRLSNGWTDLSRGEGLAGGDLRETMTVNYGWFKPRNYFIPSSLVRSGQENCITLWITDPGGKSGAYDGPIMLSSSVGTLNLAGAWKTGNLDISSVPIVSRVRIRCNDNSIPSLRRFAAYSKLP